MRSLDHYLDLIDDTDTVGAQLLAEALYALRHGDADTASPDDLRPIVRDLPESVTAGQAYAHLACAALASDDGRDKGQTTLAERLGVGDRTVRSWIAGGRSPGGPAVKMMGQIIEGANG